MFTFLCRKREGKSLWTEWLQELFEKEAYLFTANLTPSYDKLPVSQSAPLNRHRINHLNAVSLYQNMAILIVLPSGEVDECYRVRTYNTTTCNTHWDVEVRSAFGKEVDIWTIYCNVMWKAECHRQTLRTRKLCILGTYVAITIFIIYTWGTHSWNFPVYFWNTLYN
jgi:hypothetical protein